MHHTGLDGSSRDSLYVEALHLFFLFKHEVEIRVARSVFTSG